MPRGDRTGSAGMGSMTGWGRGLCNGTAIGGYSYRTVGRRCWMPFPGYGADEKEYLEMHIKRQELTLAALKQRLEQIGDNTHGI